VEVEVGGGEFVDVAVSAGIGVVDGIGTGVFILVDVGIPIVGVAVASG
jgi:hypothetical protein